jgi:hypothetical protein
MSATSLRLLGSLARWTERARQEGLTGEQIRLLLDAVLDDSTGSRDAGHTEGGVA